MHVFENSVNFRDRKYTARWINNIHPQFIWGPTSQIDMDIGLLCNVGIYMSL